MQSKFKRGMKQLYKQRELQVFALIGVAALLLFSYLPLFGIIIAFKDYRINMGLEGIFTSEWAGLKHFREFFGFYRFNEIFKNTVILSLLKLLFTFPAPILLALLLNELKSNKFRRVVQTVSYLPNFISWVLVFTIANAFLNADTGVLNQILLHMGLTDAPVPFLTSSDWFYGVATFLAVWKNSGYWAIIFLAAISGIDPQLYEAAEMDGAGRVARIWYIGSLLGGGMGGSNFDQCYIFGNAINNSASEIIQTFAFKTGLAEGRFAYATAVDLVQSMLSVTLILISNKIAKKVTGEGIF